MTRERDITIQNTVYRVVISDDEETLFAAKAAGRVIVGVTGADRARKLPVARYLAETEDAVTERYLEQVVCREKGLPWIIGETRLITVREFTEEDAKQVPSETEDKEDDLVFQDKEKLKAYIHGQYEFFGYGLWAVERKEDKRIIGKAGITGCDEKGRMELGYHIFKPYRRRGYGGEACRTVLEYVREEYGCPVCAVVEASNDASRKLLEKLGFSSAPSVTEQKCSGSVLRYVLFDRN